MSKLDEVLAMAFMGLYGKSPSDNGMDFNFVPMEDSYGVLKDSLKDDIKALFMELIDNTMLYSGGLPDESINLAQIREKVEAL